MGPQQGATVELGGDGEKEGELSQRPTWAIPVSSAREHPVCEYHWALGEDHRLWPGKEVQAECVGGRGLEVGWRRGGMSLVAAGDLNSQPHPQV